MLAEPTVTGIYLGIVLALLFLGAHLVKKKPPKFNEVVLIMLSSVGGTLGIDFGYLVLTSDAKIFGPFQDHRITMLLGAMAVVWTSFESVVQICLPLWSWRKSEGTEVKEDVARTELKPGTPNSAAPADQKAPLSGR